MLFYANMWASLPFRMIGELHKRRIKIKKANDHALNFDKLLL